MGRMAIILVMSLVLTAGIIGYSLNQSKRYTVENVAGFDKYVSARNIAHTGVNMMLRALDRNDTTYVSKLSRGETARLNTSLMSGVCSVTVRLKNPAFKCLHEVQLSHADQRAHATERPARRGGAQGNRR